MRPYEIPPNDIFYIKLAVLGDSLSDVTSDLNFFIPYKNIFTDLSDFSSSYYAILYVLYIVYLLFSGKKSYKNNDLMA